MHPYVRTLRREAACAFLAVLRFVSELYLQTAACALIGRDSHTLLVLLEPQASCWHMIGWATQSQGLTLLPADDIALIWIQNNRTGYEEGITHENDNKKWWQPSTHWMTWMWHDYPRLQSVICAIPDVQWLQRISHSEKLRHLLTEVWTNLFIFPSRTARKGCVLLAVYGLLLSCWQHSMSMKPAYYSTL